VETGLVVRAYDLPETELDGMLSLGDHKNAVEADEYGDHEDDG
jgi:hypothetical protein